MKKFTLYFVLLLSTSFAVNSYASSPSYKVVSKCFFIYAPITETGRDMNIQSIFSYGQKRMSWIGGYIKANEKNSSFTKVFEDNIATNKKYAIILENKLRKSIKEKNAAEFNTIMSYSIGCDRTLGIKSTDVPKIPKL